jgi:hypothetical protein
VSALATTAGERKKLQQESAVVNDAQDVEQSEAVGLSAQRARFRIRGLEEQVVKNINAV